MRNVQRIAIQLRVALGAVTLTLLAATTTGCGSTQSAKLQPQPTKSRPASSSSAPRITAPTASGPPLIKSGSYRTTVTGVEPLANGDWTLTFATNGSFKLRKGASGGLALGPGSVVRGDILTVTPLSPEACGAAPSKGTYRLELSGKVLHLHNFGDPCRTRAAILAHTFTRVG